jgi:flagellar basal-body rod modification protein FlgD
MSSVSSTTNSSLLNSVSSSQVQTESTSDELGMDSFLTMLVAQLENQDPLNPMEGADFTSQLAQFSGLEAQYQSNDTLDAILDSLDQGSESEASDYIGKDIVGQIDSMEVTNGEPTGGYFELTEPAEIVIAVYDETGQEVRTLYPGSLTSGSYEVSWNGMDSSGEIVPDGTYTYEVIAKDDDGNYSLVDTTVSGTVDSIVYSNDTAYLEVNGALVHPDNVLQVVNAAQGLNITNPVDLMGETIAADAAVLAVQNGEVGCQGCYQLDGASDSVAAVIYDAYGNAVKTIDLEGQESGRYAFEWDGTNDAGEMVEDGIYSYEMVVTDEAAVDISVSGEVTGVVYSNGATCLNVGDVMVEVSSITGIGAGA